MNTQRVAELEAELAAAKETIQRLKFQIDMQPRGNVYELVEMPAAMPSPHQLRLLIDCLCNKYPTLRHAAGRTGATANERGAETASLQCKEQNRE